LFLLMAAKSAKLAMVPDVERGTTTPPGKLPPSFHKCASPLKKIAHNKFYESLARNPTEVGWGLQVPFCRASAFRAGISHFAGKLCAFYARGRAASATSSLAGAVSRGCGGAWLASSLASERCVEWAVEMEMIRARAGAARCAGPSSRRPDDAVKHGRGDNQPPRNID
jgi:hypothetical protein